MYQQHRLNDLASLLWPLLIVLSENNNGRYYTRLESNKHAIVFQDKAMAGHKRAQHPSKLVKSRQSNKTENLDKIHLLFVSVRNSLP